MCNYFYIKHFIIMTKFTTLISGTSLHLKKTSNYNIEDVCLGVGFRDIIPLPEGSVFWGHY
jgi:hypothetical protein